MISRSDAMHLCSPTCNILMVGKFRMCVDRELGWLPPEALGVRQDQGNLNHENNFAANFYCTFLCNMQVLHVEIQVYYQFITSSNPRIGRKMMIARALECAL